MKKIEIACLNPSAIDESMDMLAFAARLTQRGHSMSSLDAVLELYEKPYSPDFIHKMSTLPHPTPQKFTVINFVVVGASRRFLAQITRHQNEVKFMSASLQYSDYSNNEGFCVPYGILELDAAHAGNAEYVDNYHQTQYINSCMAAMTDYTKAREQGVDNDSCGYMAPHGLRNILLISATPFQWKHMISQRTCRRNTPEMRYVMLRIWEMLYNRAPELFGDCGPFCDGGVMGTCHTCLEGKMSCTKPMKGMSPQEILKEDFPLLCTEEIKRNFVYVEGGDINADDNT